MIKTEAEMWHEFYELAIMPCCGGERGFYKGPKGGLCQNIMCEHCGAKFNIGPIKFIQQIGEPDAEALRIAREKIAQRKADFFTPSSASEGA